MVNCLSWKPSFIHSYRIRLFSGASFPLKTCLVIRQKFFLFKVEINSISHHSLHQLQNCTGQRNRPRRVFRVMSTLIKEVPSVNLEVIATTNLFYMPQLPLMNMALILMLSTVITFHFSQSFSYILPHALYLKKFFFSESDRFAFDKYSFVLCPPMTKFFTNFCSFWSEKFTLKMLVDSSTADSFTSHDQQPIKKK